jgi:UDP-N-acetyl-D-glucosamine dehydrogenase
MELAGQASIALSPEAVSAYSAVLIATDHDAIDYGLLAKHVRMIVDTRNVMSRKGYRNTNVVLA